jgi:hypothetical protein
MQEMMASFDALVRDIRAVTAGTSRSAITSTAQQDKVS